MNADDWGRDYETTHRILECIVSGCVSSVSAMVFMEDSEHAAEAARERGIDTALHLNFSTAFSARSCSRLMRDHQERLSRYLQLHRFAQIVYNPGLSRSFEYVVAAQLDEFERLYGTAPSRIDGHHHFHLCSNVILRKLLPSGTVVRKNFSFQPGEKGSGNRIYRLLVDGLLRRRHRVVDYFFSLPPFDPADRLQRIFSLARQHVVEVETHPINPQEYQFLREGEIFRRAGEHPIAPRFAIAAANSHIMRS